MGKNRRTIYKLLNCMFIFIFISCIFFTGCNERKDITENSAGQEKISGFSFRQFSPDFNFTLKGESAEIATDREKTSVYHPALSLETNSEIIEIKTGKEGKAEMEIDPESEQIKDIVITGDIKIYLKDIKTKKITMQANCGKLTYVDKEKKLILEKSPVIKKGENSFSGERIFYLLDENKFEIKGDVNVRIYPERNISD
jgi:lipopolysaccharide transport protein LptA